MTSEKPFFIERQTVRMDGKNVTLNGDKVTWSEGFRKLNLRFRSWGYKFSSCLQSLLFSL